jgi:hypothetical protein
MRVCVINGAPGFIASLTPAPKNVTYTARPAADCDLFVAFATSRRELFAQLSTLEKDVARQTLWIAWPKKASRLKTDLDGNFVRESGLSSGWVDFKVCALDDTWSGLAFKRRR